MCMVIQHMKEAAQGSLLPHKDTTEGKKRGSAHFLENKQLLPLGLEALGLDHRLSDHFLLQVSKGCCLSHIIPLPGSQDICWH